MAQGIENCFWTEEKEVNLITLWSEKPCLFDVTSSGYIDRLKKDAAISRNPCLGPYFSHYCPTFQNASWSALAAKLWLQPTIFFASLSPFCSVTLVHAIFKRHPEVPHCRDRRKKSPSVPAVIFATAIGV